MQTKIGDFDQATHTVPVTFFGEGPTGDPIAHKRSVNACLNEDGGYDAAATATRVEEVARGVEVKMTIGAITNPPAPLEATAE